jgi:hypothetical protein
MERIDISNYKTKFEQYPEDLLSAAAEANLSLPGLKGFRGQALALMSQPEIRGQKYITRSEAEQFAKQIGIRSRDAIQGFNKETGFKRMNLHKGQYCLQYPYVTELTHLRKRENVNIQGDRDTCIDMIKKFWRDNLTDVPNSEWQIGHLDPTIDDNSEQNLTYQPPLQARYRNRFKWCSLFMKMWPTADELIPKFNDYYTEREQRRMYEHLRSRFAEPECAVVQS